MLHLKFLALTLVSLFCVGCGAGDAAPTTTKTTSTIDYAQVQKTTQSEILTTINAARAVARDCHDGKGLVSAAPALTWNDELYAAAYEHSNDLASSDTFSHYGSGTASDVTGSNNGNASSFDERIEANGYVNYSTIGENVAGGHVSIEDTVQAWINSPAHCANLMNANFKEVGVAVATNPSSTYGIYWTQNFGSKK